MAKYRLRSELLSGRLSEALAETIPTEDLGKLDSAAVQAMSNLAAIIPLIGFLLPSVMNIFQGGAGQLYTQDGARVYQPFRFPPEVIYRLAWKLHKGIDIPEDLLGDLRDQGFNQDRIDLGLEASKIMPTPQDVISFLAHEVFEPEMVKKYGLDEEWEGVDKTLFAKIGMPEDLALNYWINHWQHASFTQIVEMRRRELITDDDVWEWFRLVEIPPVWRPLLMDLVWETPTRVDIRRFWDMRTISPERLRTLYTRHGYHGEDLDDYILWTNVYTAFPDLIARYKNNWISEAEVKSELAGFGMSAERAEELWQSKIKAPHEAERVEGTKKLTRALIIKGAKKLEMPKEQVLDLLMGLNYARPEAEFIYAVEVTGAESPESYLEFKELVNKYRRSVALEVHDITQAAIDAEQLYLDAEKRLKEAREKEEPQAEIMLLEALRDETKARFEALLAQSQEQQSSE